MGIAVGGNKKNGSASRLSPSVGSAVDKAVPPSPTLGGLPGASAEVLLLHPLGRDIEQPAANQHRQMVASSSTVAIAARTNAPMPSAPFAGSLVQSGARRLGNQRNKIGWKSQRRRALDKNRDQGGDQRQPLLTASQHVAHSPEDGSENAPQTHRCDPWMPSAQI